MGSNELHALFWKLVAAISVTLIVSCSVASVSNTTKINDTLSRMVTEGISPKKAGCAVALANGNTLESTRMYCSIPE